MHESREPRPDIQANRDLWIDEAGAKATRSLKQEQIKMGSFADVVNSKKLARDIGEVRQFNTRLEREDLDIKEANSQAKHLAEILEAVIIQGGRIGWFGGEATVIKTSPYDDRKNHVDELVIFKQADLKSILALAVDVTLKSDLKNKLETIKRGIKSGDLAEISYFRNPDDGAKTKISRVPKVIIAVDYEQLQNLAELWLEDDEDSRGKLAAHPIQLQILGEIVAQCETFEKYAIAHQRIEAAEKYQYIRKIVTKIVEQKLLKMTGKHRPDSAFQELLVLLREFNKD